MHSLLHTLHSLLHSVHLLLFALHDNSTRRTRYFNSPRLQLHTLHLLLHALLSRLYNVHGNCTADMAIFLYLMRAAPPAIGIGAMRVQLNVRVASELPSLAEQGNQN